MLEIRKLFLSAFMVAGAAIGSGVLALPMLAAGPGLINTLIFISLTFILSYSIALISIDTYALYNNPNINAATLASDYFGLPGYWLSTLFNLLSMGSLAAAYVNAGGDLLVKTVLPLFQIHIPAQVGMLLFFITFMPAFIVGLSLISRINGIIFSIKFTCLSAGIILGLKLINPQIFEFLPEAIEYLGSGASTMFCIWLMHMVLPLVLKINDWNPAKAKKAVLLGLLIPAFAYIGWMLLIFSLVNRLEFKNLETIGDVMHYALSRPGVPTYISTLVGIFATITVLTAFLSIGFSLVAFIIDALGWEEKPSTRLTATLIAFAIPVMIAIGLPTAFVMIYQQSNIFQMLSALIPVAAAIKYNYRHGRPISLLWVIVILCSLIIFSQILDDFSLLPDF
jgi:tyrosine-specific transport protein